MARPDRFPLFDALRAIAALGILGYHALYFPALYQGIGDPWWWRYAAHLDIGVPIFFGISGFLLYRPFVAARAAGRPAPSVRAYAWRRALRILPAYWVALTALTLWFWWQPPGFEEVRSLEGVLRFYLFAQIYDGSTAIAGIGQAWSLGVEVVFYALLPVWAVLALRRRPGWRAEALALGGVIAASLAYKVVVLSQVDPASRDALPWLLPFPGYADHLALGMLLAVLSVHRPPWRALDVVERRPGLVWLAALAFWIAACLAGPNGRPDDPMTDGVYLLRHLFYGLAVVCVLAPAVFGDRREGGVRRFLRWRPLVYVGAISYSFYLLHFAVLDQLEAWWGRGPRTGPELLGWLVVGLAATTLVATVSYRLVERPFMRLARRTRAREGEPAAAVAAQVHAAP